MAWHCLVERFGALKLTQFQQHLYPRPSPFWLAPKGTKMASSSLNTRYPEQFYSPSWLMKTSKIRPEFLSAVLWIPLA
ncbi:hypothetical protein P4S72_05400 [Vibrio sp. PP-XX7]